MSGLSKALPEWRDYMEAFIPVGDAVLKTVPHADDPLVRQETWRGLMALIAHGLIGHVHADPDYPEFVSITNTALNILAPNPDFMYLWTPIDSQGVYRIQGFRNTALFVELGFLVGYYSMAENKGTVGTLDLDTLTLGPDTSFDVVVSRERPAGYTGDWFQMPEKASTILVRSAAYDWLREQDPVMSIERLDLPAMRPRLSAEQLSARLAELPQWVERSPPRHHVRYAELARQNIVNQLHVYDFATMGAAAGQIYMEGLYDIAADEALILEVDVPERCRYWSFMISDDQLGTVDWMNRQSSLNPYQSRIDADGKFRAVVSVADPGVPNWLDTGGYTFGMIWGRWNNASSEPVPTVTKVKLADVRRHLPADTPEITAAMRDASLRERRKGAQFRRRW